MWLIYFASTVYVIGTISCRLQMHYLIDDQRTIIINVLKEKLESTEWVVVPFSIVMNLLVIFPKWYGNDPPEV